MDDLKIKLMNREVTIGSWITFSDPAIAEIMAKSGFDWLAVDMEHSGLSFGQAQGIIRVIDLYGIAPLVRVMENNPELIKRFLDAGAHGVIIPMVKSKNNAERAVHAVKYPPLGSRGVGLARAQNYSLDFDSYREWNQENSIVMVQIEHIKGVENLDSIMNVDGVDGFIIGLYDLSGSLGVPGQFEHPLVIEALNEIHRVSKNNNYLMGQHVVSVDHTKVLDAVENGIKFIGFGVDFLFLGEHTKTGLTQIRETLNK